MHPYARSLAQCRERPRPLIVAPASISLSVEPARRCQLTATVLHVRVLLKLQLEDHNLRQDSDVP